MNDPANISQAWRFVNGFDVPALSADMRESWGILIDQLSPAQFAAGERGSRTRRSDQLHLRPSIEAFKGYAGFGLNPTSYDTKDSRAVRRLARVDDRPKGWDVAAFCDDLRAKHNLPTGQSESGKPRAKTNVPCASPASSGMCERCGWDALEHKREEVAS